MRLSALATVLLACIVLAFPDQALAKRLFNQYVGFGDSTLDSGYFRYNSTGLPVFDRLIAAAVARGAQGGFAGPGIMNSQFLASRFGLSGGPIGGGGFNFANGGSFSAPLRANPSDPVSSGVEAPTNVALSQQIANYLASVGGAANPHALYLIKTGDNDLVFYWRQSPSWIAANPSFLAGLAAFEAINVAALQAAGARTIMVPNSYNYAICAGMGGFIAPGNAAQYATSQAYGNMRWASLAAAGVRFIPADIDSLMRFVVQHPTLFGFTPSSVLPANAATQLTPLLTSWDTVNPAQMQSILFVNPQHLTTAGQMIESDYEYGLVTAPVLMSLLAENAVQGGLSRTGVIQGQIDQSSLQRGQNGVNVWASGGVGSLAIRSFSGLPGITGTPFTGSTGADYRTDCGLVLGAAFTAGTQTQRLTMVGGRFEQDDQTLSLYGAYKAGPVWGDVIASYGRHEDKTVRQAPLGLFGDQNTANVDGDSLGLALRAGGDIQLGPISTGPVAGLVLQRVHIKGFTESGTSGVTALSFGEQIRNSAVTQLGWRASADLGRWRPFVEGKWNHELTDTRSRQVKAALTTVTAPAYYMDAAPTEADWASATMGTSFKVNDRLMLRLSTSATAFNPQVISYGGDVGVSVHF